MHTSSLSWEYPYSGIRLVGLRGAGTVIQCIKEGCRGPRHCICYRTTGVARVVEVLTPYIPLLPLTTHH